MTLELGLLLLYVVAGIGAACAGMVWWVASLAVKPDALDGTFLVFVSTVIVAVWPLVVLGIAVAHLLRRMQVTPVDESSG